MAEIVLEDLRKVYDTGVEAVKGVDLAVPDGDLCVLVGPSGCGTFAVIDATTGGGPNQATNILVYKVYQDGFVGLDLGSSAAQSAILMLIVIALTVVQFRYIERRVNY